MGAKKSTMDLTNCPPQLLFVHEWWVELRDDLKMAGALFNCAVEHLPDEVQRTMAREAEAALLAAHAQHRFPETPQRIIYGIWLDPDRDWRPVIGQVPRDEWLGPLRDGVTTPDGTGFVQVIRIPRTDADRARDPGMPKL